MAWRLGKAHNIGRSRLNVHTAPLEDVVAAFMHYGRWRGTTFLALLPDGSVTWCPNRRGSLMARIIEGVTPGEIIGAYNRESTSEQVMQDLLASDTLAKRRAA